MRIQYDDPVLQMKAMIQEILELGDSGTSAHLLVTKDEMTKIVRHRDAPVLFADYFDPIVKRKTEIHHEMLRLNEEVRQKHRLSEREAIFNKVSDLEIEHHELSQRVPAELTYCSIPIKVSMRG